MKKGVRAACFVLSFCLLLLAAAFSAAQVGFGFLYFDFYSSATQDFMIPGLSTGYVPQGFDYIEQLDIYLMCGYMSNGSASRVYVQDAKGENFFISLRNADGSAYTRHAGGICQNGEYAFLAGSAGIDVFSLADILDGKDAVLLGTIPTGYGAAYCCFHDGLLFAGSYYHEKSHETPQYQRLSTPAGDENKALITVFQASADAPFGIDPEPVAAISTRGEVQGICFTDRDQLVMSVSYGLTSSYLQFYDLDLQRRDVIELSSASVPLYYLDSANLTRLVKLPPMAEELVYRDAKVYIMCESAANKYFFGKLLRGYQVYAYNVD